MQNILALLRIHWRKVLVFSFKLAFIIGLFVLLFRPETFGLRSDLFRDITPARLWGKLRNIDPATAAIWLTARKSGSPWRRSRTR